MKISKKCFVSAMLCLCMILSAMAVFAEEPAVTLNVSTTTPSYLDYYGTEYRFRMNSACLRNYQTQTGVTLSTSAAAAPANLYVKGNVVCGPKNSDGTWPVVYVEDVPVLKVWNYGNSLTFSASYDALTAAQSSKTFVKNTFAASTSGWTGWTTGNSLCLYYKELSPANMAPRPLSKLGISQFDIYSSKIRILSSPASIKNAYGNWAIAEDGQTPNLAGAVLNGYVTVNPNGALASQVNPASKIYFNNVPLTFGAYSTWGSGIYPNFPRSADYITDITDEGATLPWHKPDCLSNSFANGTYDFSNLYITNSATTNAIEKVLNDDGTYTLTTDGANLMKLIKVTYNDNGNVGEVLSEAVHLSNENPYVVEVAENQKVFAWKEVPLSGTTMKPLCEPLLGANFR